MLVFEKVPIIKLSPFVKRLFFRCKAWRSV